MHFLQVRHNDDVDNSNYKQNPFQCDCIHWDSMKHTDVADYILFLTLIDFLHCVKHDNLQPELNKAILAMYKFMLLPA